MNDVVVRPDLRIPAHELTERASRSGGPGGQHVNKTSTRVELRWSIAETTALRDDVKARLLARLHNRLTSDGELIVVADEHRSQLMNREAARERLAAIVRDALVVPKKRVATKPGKSAERRRIDAKKRVSATKAARQRGDWDDE